MPNNRPPRTITLYDYGRGSRFVARQRRNQNGSNGPAQFSIRIDAQPLVITLSDEVLGRGPAKAIENIIKQQIRDIPQRSPEDPSFAETLARRSRYRKAITSGSPAAKARAIKLYTLTRGENKGLFLPGGVGEYRDSGMLIASLTTSQVTRNESFIINFSSQRLRSRNFVDGLFARVRALRDPSSLLRNNEFLNALRRAETVIVTKGTDTARAKRVAANKVRIERTRNVINLFRGFFSF